MLRWQRGGPRGRAVRDGDPRDPILGVLGQRTTDDVPLIIHAVDDQAALRHRHRGDRVADIGGNPPLEVELVVLNAPEQLPEDVSGEGRGHFAELRDRRHLPPRLSNLFSNRGNRRFDGKD